MHFLDAVQLIRAIKRQAFSIIVVDTDHPDSIDPAFWDAVRRFSSDAAMVSTIDRARPGGIDCAGTAGADDILFIPTDPCEVRLRVQFVLRRLSTQRVKSSSAVRCGQYVLDRQQGNAWVNGTSVQLTPREFALAWLLFSHLNRFISRREIAAHVWGSYEEVAGRSLEQHVYKLRQKLRLEPPARLRLDTVHGHGYRLSEI